MKLKIAMCRTSIRWIGVAAFCCLILSPVGNNQITQAQSNTPRFEIGGQFSAIRADNFPGSTFGTGTRDVRTDLGGGGRFSINLNRYIALESEVNFFKEKFTLNSPTRPTFEATKIEGLFGAKAGIRGRRIGLFGKVRPGFMHFDRDSACPGCDIKGNFELALDAGGVLEFYPSRKFVVRFDAGDTMIFLEEKSRLSEGFRTVFLSATTLHKLQFSVGAAFRF